MLITARRLTATAAATSLLAVPALALTAGPAAAVEQQKRCSGALVQLEAERDDGRHEVSADIDDANRGERWKIVVKKNGNKIADVTRSADDEGDISVDRNAANTAGRDRYVMKATSLRTDRTCTVRVVRAYGS